MTEEIKEKMFEIHRFLKEKGFIEGKDYGFSTYDNNKPEMPCLLMNLGFVPIIYRMDDPFFTQLAQIHSQKTDVQ